MCADSSTVIFPTEHLRNLFPCLLPVYPPPISPNKWKASFGRGSS